MRFVLLAVIAGALLLAAPAAADIRYGIADDYGKYSEDGGEWFYSELAALGAKENRVTVVLEEGQVAISDNDIVRLRRIAATSRKYGIDLVLAVYARRFADYNPETICGTAVRAVQETGAKLVVVGNEVNKGLDPVVYEAVASKCMGDLSPLGVTVIGGALSARKTTGASMSPLEYIVALARAYKAANRQTPLMHQLAVHFYPNPERSDGTYDWPGVWITQLRRLYQTFEDAFGGGTRNAFALAATAQPTFSSGLKARQMEIGKETKVKPEHAHLYHGTEVSPTVEEEQQGPLYRSWGEILSCEDPFVAMHTFLGFDEANLAGAGLGQTALGRPDRSHKPSFDVIRDFLASTGGRCTGATRTFTPTTGIIDASARAFTRVVGKQRFARIEFSSDEGVKYDLKVVKGGKTVLSKSGQIATTARNILAGQATPKAIGGGKWTLTLTDLLVGVRSQRFTGIVPTR